MDSALEKIRYKLRLRKPSGEEVANTTSRPGDVETPPVALNTVSGDNDAINTVNSTAGGPEYEDLKPPMENVQRGVEKIEAVTMAWTRESLAALLILIWFLFLTNGFKGAILYSLTPFATSEFSSHSLLTVISIVSSAMTSAVYIPMAKMLDVWGRAEGFLVMTGLATLGLILMAVSHNLATFCAAQVFYSVGFGGLTYAIVVLAADATNLRNRGLGFAFTSSPYMITAFAGSKAAEQFLLKVNWRWGFGAFAIILPFVATPLYLVLKFNLRKAEKEGIISKMNPDTESKSLWEKVYHFLVEFDIFGVVLFAVGLTVFLLPFTLATSAPKQWKTDYIIAMIVVGFVLLVVFVLYQMYLSPSPFLKNEFLMDRTVMGACLLNFTYQVSYYCWSSYFSSFLQVVNNLTVAEAGYVGSTFQVVSGVLLFIVGYFIRRTGYFRWVLVAGVPLYIFAQGLMIYFRRPNGHIGYIVMCEIFISVGGSVFILCAQLAVLVAVDHQHVAAVLAMLFVIGGIGDAIGSTISGAIWTNTFAPALQRYLPEEALPNLVNIYTSLPVQLSYLKGSAERLAIQKAYGYAQARMLTAGTVVMVLSLIWVFMIRNYNVKNMSQTKGVVF